MKAERLAGDKTKRIDLTNEQAIELISMLTGHVESLGDNEVISITLFHNRAQRDDLRTVNYINVPVNVEKRKRAGDVETQRN